ncbi:MAG: MBL fold metallo-hydrolase [Clostridia bacterium]|nr:MBL fold metallo-hydrolase [Clostridia bacterium]
MKITWLGQSGYLLCDETHAVCIDPYLSDCVERIAGRKRLYPAPFAPEDLKADCVICTHDHPDHLDIDAIGRMDERILFLAPGEALPHLKALGAERCAAFDEGEKVVIGDFVLEAVFARHSVPAVGVLVRHGGRALYFSGDTEYDVRLGSLPEVDGAFICINGRLGNMNAEDAVKLAKILKPRFASPNHFDMLTGNTVDPSLFTDKVDFAWVPEHGKEYDLECLI